MNRKSKLFFSLVSLCFSIAVLCFGVYSALSVSYSINGSVSYEIQDVFVELDLSVYRAMSTTPVNSATHNQNVSTIKDALGDTIPSGESGFSQLTQYQDHESSYEDGMVQPGNEYGVYKTESPKLDLTYGSPTNDNQGYAFYIILDIQNLGTETINAQIQAPTSLENTILSDSGNIEISAQTTNRIVLGLALDDATRSIDDIQFNYTITITRGELPVEEITDFSFTIDESAKTATLTSYSGTGGIVTIPESIGCYTVPQEIVTLTFDNMDDLGNNAAYLFMDANIQTASPVVQPQEHPVENAYMWFTENMESIQSNSDLYFPMTITTVKNQTFDYENDYQYLRQIAENMYSTSGVSNFAFQFSEDTDIVVDEFTSTVAQMCSMFISYPIMMVAEGLIDGIELSYPNGSFTLTAESYSNAMDDTNTDETSVAIRDFMMVMQGVFTEKNFVSEEIFASKLKTILPISYSNIKYPGTPTDIFVEGSTYKVTSIASNAFVGIDSNTLLSDCILNPYRTSVLDIYSLTIPATINSIASDAFVNSFSMVEVYNYSSLDVSQYLQPMYLYNSDDLQSIVPESSITEINNVYYLENGDNLVALGLVDPYVTEIRLDSRTTAISQYAFAGYNMVQDFYIPQNVKTVGDFGLFGHIRRLHIENISSWASLEFQGSNYHPNMWLTLVVLLFGLTGETLPDYLLDEIQNGSIDSLIAKLYYGGQELTGDIQFERSIEKISPFAFLGCSKITSINLPEGLKEIGESAFSGCSNLTSVTIPSSLTIIGDDAFSDCNSIAEIYNYSGLNISNSASEDANGGLGSHAKVIYNKNDLIGGKPQTTIIKDDYFQYFVDENNYIVLAPVESRYAVDNIVISPLSTSIDDYAFSGLSALESLTIPSKFIETLLGGTLLEDCTRLQKIHISDENDICKDIDGILYSSDGTQLLYCPVGRESVIIPDSVTTIESNSFNKCINLTSVTFTDNTKLNTIKSRAFIDCSRLTSLVIPSTVQTIETNAFEDCYGLKEIYNLSALDITVGNTENGNVAQYAKVVNKSMVETRIWHDDFAYYYLDGEEQYAIATLNSRLNEIKFDENTTVVDMGTFINIPSGVSVYFTSKIKSVDLTGLRSANAFYISSNDVLNYINEEKYWGGALGSHISGLGTGRIYVDTNLTVPNGFSGHFDEYEEIYDDEGNVIDTVYTGYWTSITDENETVDVDGITYHKYTYNQFW